MPQAPAAGRAAARHRRQPLPRAAVSSPSGVASRQSPVDPRPPRPRPAQPATPAQPPPAETPPSRPQATPATTAPPQQPLDTGVSGAAHRPAPPSRLTLATGPPPLPPAPAPTASPPGQPKRRQTSGRHRPAEPGGGPRGARRTRAVGDLRATALRRFRRRRDQQHTGLVGAGAPAAALHEAIAARRPAARSSVG